MTTILRDAVRNSERKGYHITRVTPDQLKTWRSKVDPHFAINYKGPANPSNANSNGNTAPAAPEAAAAPAPAPAAAETPAAKPVKIFVGNLSYRVTPLDLEFVFQQFGKLVSSDVNYDENGRVSTILSPLDLF